MRREKLKQYSAGIMAVVMSGMLIFGSQTTVFAAEEEKKEDKTETVYVNADADGTSSKVTVSEWLQNHDASDVINDYSTLKNIKNVKGEETFTEKGHGSLEWKEKSGSLMPQQIKMDVSYNTKVNVTLKAFDSIDFKDIVKKANDNFENKIEKCGIQLSGIDMSDRLLLGVIGFNFAVSPTANLKEIAEQTAMSIKPKFFVALYLDLSGELTAELSVSYDYSSYRECSFNVCNSKAKNIEGINSAIYTEQKKLVGNYEMGTYERERKSKTEFGKPEPKVTFDGKVEVTHKTTNDHPLLSDVELYIYEKEKLNSGN